MTNTLADWSSVIQLLCAHTLLIRGYVEYTEGTQDKAAKMLEDAQLQLEAACEAQPYIGPELPTITQFEWIDWNKTPPQILNRHRKHLTTWFWDRRIAARKVESNRNTVLVLIGAIALLLLLSSATIGSIHVPPLVGLGVAVLLWTPVIDIMGGTWLDDRDLRNLIEMPGEQPRQEPSATPFKGMIYALCNEIRRKYGKGYKHKTHNAPSPLPGNGRRKRRRKSPPSTTREPLGDYL
ncbi:hypothetical protein ACU8OQ_12365 [Rhizobium leguminosarum]